MGITAIIFNLPFSRQQILLKTTARAYYAKHRALSIAQSKGSKFLEKRDFNKAYDSYSAYALQSLSSESQHKPERSERNKKVAGRVDST